MTSTRETDFDFSECTERPDESLILFQPDIDFTVALRSRRDDQPACELCRLDFAEEGHKGYYRKTQIETPAGMRDLHLAVCGGCEMKFAMEQARNSMFLSKLYTTAQRKLGLATSERIISARLTEFVFVC
jgi:hypothetical protein